MRLIVVLAAGLAGSLLAGSVDARPPAGPSRDAASHRWHDAAWIELAQGYDDDPFYDDDGDGREEWDRREDRARERTERRREEHVRRDEQRRNRELDRRNRELDARNRELDRRNREIARRQRDDARDDHHRRRVPTYQLGNTPFRVDGQGRLAPGDRD